MSRPRKCRKVCCMPSVSRFGPLGGCITDADPVQMTVDEYETIRLIDLEGMNQEACAAHMNVARTTVQGIYLEARRKIAQALVENGLDAQHEVRLAPRCRIDFMSGGVGIEIKKSRPERAKLIAQLTRYAGCEQVESLVVAAPRGVNLPKMICGKRVSMVALERLWGISLP